MGEDRERWSSRVAFIFASVGAAVGFGNIWRFPSLAYKYGGGAFFIPYLLALFFIGIPLLVLEFGLGQYHQMGDVGVFGSINKRLRGIGLSSVANGYFVVIYYCALIAWVIRAFFDSFTEEGINWETANGSDAFGYFLNNIVGMDDLDLSQWPTLLPTKLIWPNVGFLSVVWFVIWLCVAWGLKWTGRITYFTMGLPIVLLFVFLGRAVSLPGASDGIKAYIGIWDLSVLKSQPDCWSTAVSQIFFSIGVTFGIMTAFGSHCERDAPCFANSCIVAMSNSLFSFIAGFAVFASLGYLAQEENKDISELPVAGPGLVFGAWPVVLAKLPGGQHWVRLFFFNCFLLGIDSAFALCEAVITVAKDTVLLQHTSRKVVSAGICIFAFVGGLLYCTDTGFLFLDVVDFYINFIMLLVGFFESFAAGWVYGLERQVERLGWKPVFTYMVTTFGSVIVASGLWFGMKENAMLLGFVALIGWYLIGMALTLFFCFRVKKEQGGERTWKSLLYDLFLRNVFELTYELQGVVGYIPLAWAILIKHVIPPLLLILFINLALSETGDGVPQFGNYEGYVIWPYQVLGILIVALTCFVILVGLAVPQAYSCMSTAPDEIEEDENEKEAASEKNIEVAYSKGEDYIVELDKERVL